MNSGGCDVKNKKKDIVWVVKLCVKVTFCVLKNVFFYKPGY